MNRGKKLASRKVVKNYPHTCPHAWTPAAVMFFEMTRANFPAKGTKGTKKK
jgi:hypothetical protein